ncbi:MAG: CBS domain-containing protein [Oscillospiraceae bacterium]|nr:CBS domain-containing protein [Oscillospiraceae bacterium]
MNGNVISIAPEESASLAARLLNRYNVGALPVCGAGQILRGILTDRDIVMRCIAADGDPEHTPVKEIMTRNVATVLPEDDVRNAARLMASKQVRRLPVVENGKLVGMLSLGDMAKSQMFDMEASKALSEISANIKRR